VPGRYNPGPGGGNDDLETEANDDLDNGLAPDLIPAPRRDRGPWAGFQRENKRQAIIRRGADCHVTRCPAARRAYRRRCRPGPPPAAASPGETPRAAAQRGGISGRPVAGPARYQRAQAPRAAGASRPETGIPRVHPRPAESGETPPDDSFLNISQTLPRGARRYRDHGLRRAGVHVNAQTNANGPPGVVPQGRC
jgi:hypothetical protein